MHSTVYTERLRLTRVERLDIGFLSYCLNSPEAHGAFLSTSVIAPETVEMRFRSGAYWNDDSKTFIVKLKEAGTRIGMFHYWVKSDDRSTAMYTIQIAVAEHRNLGYGTEVQLAAVDALFRQTPLDNIEVYTEINNIAEVRCLEKIGFQYCDSKTYIDMDVERTGSLYRLTRKAYFQMRSLLG